MFICVCLVAWEKCVSATGRVPSTQEQGNRGVALVDWTTEQATEVQTTELARMYYSH